MDASDGEEFNIMTGKAGFEGGTIEFYRNRPNGSPLQNSDIRTIPLIPNTTPLFKFNQ